TKAATALPSIPSSSSPSPMASDPTELRCSSPESSGDAGAEDPAAVDAAEESGGEGGSGHIAAGTEAAPPRPPEPEPEKVARHGVLPLLGKPYFTCIMCKSHVQPPFQVVVPRSFAPLLPSRTTPATLSWRGRSWGMRFTGGRLIQRLEAGWRGFAVDNDLRLGDGCVFELLVGGGGEQERVEFRVQVLRAEIPARIRGRAGGYTSATPIVID
uniref:TF-B3 domain-containing protein n=1 Tax=Oryza glaberrima TaxID=4538 RepID=I1P630_ORYGL